MKSLTVTYWKIPEGCSKCFWKMKSKKVFSKYVIQNDPEKYHAVNILSNINSLALFYDWVCYSMDWSLLGYPGQSHLRFPKALPQISTFTNIQAISFSVDIYPSHCFLFKIWNYWNYEKNPWNFNKIMLLLTKIFYLDSKRKWKRTRTRDLGQQAQTKTASSHSQKKWGSEG